jgi:8-oxo-dGTP diphosphatase
MNTIKYCPNCGKLIGWKIIEQKKRLYCNHCHLPFYDQLKVGAGGLIENEGKLLLIQRTRDPFINTWNLPAGYVEVDESPIQAIIREVFEETSLKVETEKLVDVYFFSDDPRGNGILIIYKCKLIGGTPKESLEGKNPTYFSPSDVPDNIAGGGHDQAVITWRKGYKF